MALFFDPEIQRHKKRGIIGDDFQLIAAQTLFFPDGIPVDVIFFGTLENFDKSRDKGGKPKKKYST